MNLAVLFLVLFVSFMIYNENDQYAKKVSVNLRKLKFVKGRFVHFAGTTFSDWPILDIFI